jgi:hypothetical protein
MKRLMAVLLLAAACGPALSRGDGEGEAPERLQLCIENATAAYGAITARAGMVRYDVMPGQTQCRPLMTPGPVTLRATTIGGGAAGPMRYAATLQAAGYRCWRWRLTDSPASAVDLGPCPSEFDGVADDTTATDSIR